eukprot:CAMPEP_0204326198 /NCGR_PEP_ID=MMETSP0469-20131031/11622_1 /ASSEMBLY_ACC=CAM_ASM_000384 /TAXON_ID=2969 /ORGANISM="Oxyrrhis marina" /LENGTH=328 /DNA_ID=CAMNT_0051308187 /DNA_START=1 /DNA_END=984 /DNA_ORIENTATION=+
MQGSDSVSVESSAGSPGPETEVDAVGVPCPGPSPQRRSESRQGGFRASLAAVLEEPKEDVKHRVEISPEHTSTRLSFADSVCSLDSASTRVPESTTGLSPFVEQHIAQLMRENEALKADNLELESRTTDLTRESLQLKEALAKMKLQGDAKRRTSEVGSEIRRQLEGQILQLEEERDNWKRERAGLKMQNARLTLALQRKVELLQQQSVESPRKVVTPREKVAQTRANVSSQAEPQVLWSLMRLAEASPEAFLESSFIAWHRLAASPKRHKAAYSRCAQELAAQKARAQQLEAEVEDLRSALRREVLAHRQESHLKNKDNAGLLGAVW